MVATQVTRKAGSFARVRKAGLTFPDVEATTRYDGTPVLRIHGVFVAGLARHRTAEPGTLVVRANLDERDWMLADAPDTYYITDYYRPYPLVLARLSRLNRDAIRDLLTVSVRLALAKTRKGKDQARATQGDGHLCHERRSSARRTG